MRGSFRWALLGLLLAAAPAAAQTREQKVLADRKKVEAEGFWIYNDLPRGFAEAKKTGNPMLVVLRCIPCEECVKLDDDLLHEDPRVRPLLEKFVRVRVVSTNGLDLSLFQFDYDQSFAVFLLNGDGAIYGRFGTRSHRTSWSDDVSVEGLARAMEGALELHARYPANRDELARKRGPAQEVASPERFPSLAGKYGPNITYESKVVQSCIHCHQIGDAKRQLYRDRGEPIPEAILFPYPHPKAVGLTLDPRQRASVRAVEKGSLAEAAGFRSGDRIVALEGQTPLSIADVQWVLHQASPDGASLIADVRREDGTARLTLTLPSGWRRRDDLSWRATTWELRRMALGGILFEEVAPGERAPAGVPANGTALRIKHLGMYGEHAAALKAGFRKGDVVVAFDGRADLARETDMLAYALARRKAGEQVPVTVLREGNRVTLNLPMQR